MVGSRLQREDEPDPAFSQPVGKFDVLGAAELLVEAADRNE
jgi:hypothetical protein